MDMNTIAQEYELIQFLFREVTEQLEAKGQNRTRWQQMSLIDKIVRENFPNCLQKHLEQMSPPPTGDC